MSHVVFKTDLPRCGPCRPSWKRHIAPRDVKVVGFDVVVNRPKVAAYRAPGGPISEFAVESVVDEIAKRLGLDPIEFRLKNAAKELDRVVDPALLFALKGLVQKILAGSAAHGAGSFRELDGPPVPLPRPLVR